MLPHSGPTTTPAHVHGRRIGRVHCAVCPLRTGPADVDAHAHRAAGAESPVLPEQGKDTEAPYNEQPGTRLGGHRSHGLRGRHRCTGERRSRRSGSTHVHSFTGASTSGYLGTISQENKDKYSASGYEDLREDTIIYGSPETVIEKIKYMEELTGANSLILHFPPYNTREQNKRVLKQFAEDVIPKFR